MNDFDKEVELETEKMLEKMKNRCKEIFKLCIQQEIYDRYTPVEYIHTYNMLNSVDVKIQDDSIIVYNNFEDNNMRYYSAVDRSNQTENITYFLQGHDDNSTINNYYHHYPKSNYLEKAKKMIQKEFNIKVEIITI